MTSCPLYSHISLCVVGNSNGRCGMFPQTDRWRSCKSNKKSMGKNSANIRCLDENVLPVEAGMIQNVVKGFNKRNLKKEQSVVLN